MHRSPVHERCTRAETVPGARVSLENMPIAIIAKFPDMVLLVAQQTADQVVVCSNILLKSLLAAQLSMCKHCMQRGSRCE